MKNPLNLLFKRIANHRDANRMLTFAKAKEQSAYWFLHSKECTIDRKTALEIVEKLNTQANELREKAYQLKHN